MMRKTGLILSLAVVVCMGTFFVQGALAADPIVIGIPTSTGFLEGKEALKAVNLAVDEINAKGGVDVGGADHIIEALLAKEGGEAERRIRQCVLG